jgi:hypothetical protein
VTWRDSTAPAARSSRNKHDAAAAPNWAAHHRSPTIEWSARAACGVAITLSAATAILLFFGGSTSKNVYEEGVARATGNSAVRAALGSPIRRGLFFLPGSRVAGHEGKADLSVEIFGPKGVGKVYIVGTRHAGQWTYSTILVEVSRTGERIDALSVAP